jgi:hypothetical protein
MPVTGMIQGGDDGTGREAERIFEEMAENDTVTAAAHGQVAVGAAFLPRRSVSLRTLLHVTFRLNEKG